MTINAGTHLGRYEIRSRIGAGGMGEVYLARDTELGRAVALKILPSELASDKEHMRRFRQEARTASALNHPNVAHIYEIGESHGTHFIAMEFIEGEPLRSLIRKRSIQAQEAIDIATQVAAALRAAHQAGVLHRDIKPENIMVRADGFIKVLDFGIAKYKPKEATEVDAEAATKELFQTQPGTIIGTVPYMSPEQARGERMDERSDLFSLGTVLYEMVTGHHPFSKPTAAETISALLLQEPPSLASFNNASAEFQPIINRCLNKNRTRRYQSADELLEDLKGLRATGQTSLAAHTEPSPSIAVLPFVNMSNDAENEYFCDGLAEELINALTKLEQLRVAARTSAFSFKGKETDICEIGEKLKVATILEGSVRKAGDRVRITAQLISVADGYHLWSERYDRKMEDVFEIQDEITLAIVETLKLKLLGEKRAALLKRHTDNTEVYHLYLKGRYYWNIRISQTIRKAIECFEQAIELEPDYPLPYAGLADCYCLLGMFGGMPPEVAMPKAKAAATKALELDDQLAEAHTSLAFVIAVYDWNRAAATKEIERAIEINPGYAFAHEAYGRCLSVWERAEDSLAQLNEALRLDPLSPAILGGIGNSYYFAHSFDESIEYCQKALELDSHYVPALYQLGLAYVQKGMHAEALDCFERALAAAGTYAPALASLGHVYTQQGKREEALKILERLDELSARAYIPSYYRAWVYVGLGEKEKALEMLERAFNERSALMLSINVDPILIPLHTEPRFQELGERFRAASTHRSA